jgi:hypothetical protein
MSSVCPTREATGSPFGQASMVVSPAAFRSTFTPSLTVIVPLPSTSQSSSQLLLKPAAARSVCTPSLTETLPSPLASPQTANATLACRPTRAVATSA